MTFKPSDPYRYTTETIASGLHPEYGIRYERAYLVFDDWFGRRCEVYVEALIPEGDSIAGILHCVGGGQTINPADLQFWASRGIACASFDWQIGVEGRPKDRESRWPDGVSVQYLSTMKLENAILPLALQAGRTTLSWLESFDTVAPERLGVMGISWGGYMTWMVGAYDDRPKAIAPVYGSGVFGPGNEGRKKNNSDEVNAFWETHWDPQSLADKQTAAACYLSASDDFFGNLEEADRLLGNLNVPIRSSYMPNCDHSLGAGEGALAVAWMEHYLSGGPAVPASPILNEILEVTADDSLPIEKTEIWWTASECLPRFACWHCGTPEQDSFRMAFAKVYYANGTTLCSRLLKADKTEERDIGATWPDLTAGTGWRWELGSTQHYENEVSLEKLDGGERIRVVAQRKNPDFPIGVQMHQINDPDWAPSGDDSLELGWSQEGDLPEMTATLINTKDPAELTVDCPRSGNTCRIELPESLTWADIRDLRINIALPRIPEFIMGPLKKVSKE